MPSYKFVCDACNDVTSRILSRPLSQLAPEERAKIMLCKSCGAPTRRIPPNTSVSVYERLDNGSMPHAVERLKDAEQLSKDRGRQDPRTKGDA